MQAQPHVMPGGEHEPQLRGRPQHQQLKLPQYLIRAQLVHVVNDQPGRVKQPRHLYDFGTTVMKFTCADVADRVTAPTLVTSDQDDQLVIPAAGQGPEVYQRLRSDKTYHEFTAAEGAQDHCAPMAPQTRNQVVCDWLDKFL